MMLMLKQEQQRVPYSREEAVVLRSYPNECEMLRLPTRVRAASNAVQSLEARTLTFAVFVDCVGCCACDQLAACNFARLPAT
jgi:hypothetical protein